MDISFHSYQVIRDRICRVDALTHAIVPEEGLAFQGEGLADCILIIHIGGNECRGTCPETCKIFIQITGEGDDLPAVIILDLGHRLDRMN